MPNLDVRPEVAAFALAMERELRDNDYKGGWEKEEFDFLLNRLGQEVQELNRAVYQSIHATSDARRATMQQKVLSEAADVANFAMMVPDVLGLLDTTAIAEGKEQSHV